MSDQNELEIQQQPPEKKPSRSVELIDYIETCILSFCVVLILFTFVFRLCTVRGDSMNNTLIDKEWLLVSDLCYSPERQDIIVFHQTGTLNEPIVKRVIATEGETVSIRHYSHHMTVTVTDRNGATTVLEEDYMLYEGFAYYTENYDLVVPEGKLFVMGDNRNNSKDSRHPDIGLVDERRVLGKVVLRLTPFSKFGSVK